MISYCYAPTGQTRRGAPGAQSTISLSIANSRARAMFRRINASATAAMRCFEEKNWSYTNATCRAIRTRVLSGIASSSTGRVRASRGWRAIENWAQSRSDANGGTWVKERRDEQ